MDGATVAAERVTMGDWRGMNPDSEASEPLVDLELAEQYVLGGEARYTPAQIWGAAGVDEVLARQLWLAMGFPRTPDDEPSLTERDLEALLRAKQLLSSGAFDPDELVAQTRVMSQAMSTIATAHVETLVVGDRSAGFLQGLVDGRTGDGSVEGGPAGRNGATEPADLLDALDTLLPFLYRRHLLAALARVTLGAEGSRDALPVTVVGFADLSDFSAATARATEQELTELVDDFASIAANLVANAGGRVVKLIGDEVMFRVEDPHRAADLALALAEAVQDPGLPPVHVGMAMGPVLSHHGDLFGSTVNVASRLSDVAKPGTVLANSELADALRPPAGSPGGPASRFDTRRVHLRSLKGIGHIQAYVLRRSGAPEE